MAYMPWKISQAYGSSFVTNLLNRSQYNELAIVLRTFEEHLREAASWLKSPSSSGILYEYSLQLSPERRLAVLSLIDEALAGIARLSATFGLRPASEDLGRRIAARMSIDWANLTDACSDKLKRFGDVDPSLGELLDPDLERLAALALSISSLVGRTSK